MVAESGDAKGKPKNYGRHEVWLPLPFVKRARGAHGEGEVERRKELVLSVSLRRGTWLDLSHISLQKRVQKSFCPEAASIYRLCDWRKSRKSTTRWVSPRLLLSCTINKRRQMKWIRCAGMCPGVPPFAEMQQGDIGPRSSRDRQVFWPCGTTGNIHFAQRSRSAVLGHVPTRLIYFFWNCYCGVRWCLLAPSQGKEEPDPALWGGTLHGTRQQESQPQGSRRHHPRPVPGANKLWGLRGLSLLRIMNAEWHSAARSF